MRPFEIALRRNFLPDLPIPLHRPYIVGTMQFWKYHALGNDYLVLDGCDGSVVPPPQIRRICDRHCGLGSDGVLIHRPAQLASIAAVQIMNPDGSEAEKSGNGLRIFSRYLWDRRLVAAEPFCVQTLGGEVTCQVLTGGAVVVDMGRVSFRSRDIPIQGEDREVLNESLELPGEQWTFSAATVGNPHCVIVCNDPTEALARRLGPLIETHSWFPQRTNVQFVHPLARNCVRMHIWERGAGYTLASGSSSCAAVAVLFRLDLCDDNVEVEMPGGRLKIAVAPDFSNVRMIGPVVKIAEGVISAECFEEASRDGSG
jgi:diaminopimelate epimerase